jgi:uncharacterized OB-fold protein
MAEVSIYPPDLEAAPHYTVKQPALFTDVLYRVGAIDSRFFAEIRDNRRIMGVRCPECNITYVPPRINCRECFNELSEWVEVGKEGELVTYTVVHQPGIRQPMETPYTLGIILLDGASTGLVHCLGEVNPRQVKIGMRVQAVLKQEREGNIKDIEYFKPI